MATGVVLLNFGEPTTPDRDAVVPYLTRIFLDNADLEDYDTEADARERAQELAQRRAPGLIEEYDAIGGSPLQHQSESQATALADELDARGDAVDTYVAYQFTTPLIEDVVEDLHADGIDHVIGLPIYPLCGPSTSVAANDDLATAIADTPDWNPAVDHITGWHPHPTYNRIRVDNIADYTDAEGVDLHEPGTRLVFSAHGTPCHYLEAGSRYDQYVEEWCEAMAALLDLDTYDIGYQNHENRDVPWTEPDIDDLIAAIDADRVVVEPVSFMHEQSETLSELDIELADVAAEHGLDFHRVPVPHDDDRFPTVLADLVEPFVTGLDPGYYQYRQCDCRDEPGTMCLNARRPPRRTHR